MAEAEPILATSDPPNIDQLFMDTVKGKYPLILESSTARFWAPTQEKITVEHVDTSVDPPKITTEEKNVDGRYVPRPDRSLVVLQALALFGFLGLDHFYLRSTKTAVAKLLTFGGLGVWWLWDILQVYFEKDRVVNYGMTAPFDMKIGIGQGMITDSHTEYTQNTDWVTWTISTLFGFFGSTYFFMGRYSLGLRFLIIVLLALGPMSAFLGALAEGGFLNALRTLGIFGTLFAMFYTTVMLFGVAPVWIQHLKKAIFDPADLMTTGLPTPQISADAMKYWHRLYLDSEGNVPEDLAFEYETIKTHWDPAPDGITPEELKARFWIGYHERVSLSKLLVKAPPFFVPFMLMYRMVVNVFKAIISGIGEIIGFFTGASSLKRAATIAAAAGGKGGLGGIMGKAGGVLGKVSDLKRAAEAAAGAPESMASGLLHRASAAQGMAKTLGVQVGGAAPADPLSTEAKVLGGVIAALIAGGALKAAVDYTVAK